MNVVCPVILCGGSGTRLWPLSREHYPKQLLRLVGDRSLLQATALRLTGAALGEDLALGQTLLVGNEEHRFLLAEQMREIGLSHGALILEPCGRNTAPALTLAALAAQAQDDDPVLVVMPADHVIRNTGGFQAALRPGVRLAVQGKLVTFGIPPDAPETGYGYIRRGAPCGEGACQVERFIEKPDAQRAAGYLAEGGYFWNAGIFVVRASVWLAQIRQWQPGIASACERAFAGRRQDHDFLRPDAAVFAACPSDSIDFAVMEPLTAEEKSAGEVVVVPLEAGWSDVGAWSALWEIGEKDASGNVLMGDVIAVDTSGTLVVAESRLVACVGLANAVVVETPDAVLVLDKAQAQKIKAVVAQLKLHERSEGRLHRKVYRPWGWYDTIDSATGFLVKRIQVKPGAAISLQMHKQRAEHWVVVKGRARVTCGDRVFHVGENESTYIPAGTKHRLENPGNGPLEIIEVQTGGYLGEDDIERFEDIYGRDA